MIRRNKFITEKTQSFRIIVQSNLFLIIQNILELINYKLRTNGTPTSPLLEKAKYIHLWITWTTS